MNGKYYSEELVKNTPSRQDYADSIAAFLEKAKENAVDARKGFITPEKYVADPTYYRELFIDMLGFPLREERKTPELLEKTFVAKDKNVEIYRMRFELALGIKCYGIYFKQMDGAKEKPFVIGLHGGAGTPEIVSDSANYNHLVRRITDRGASVFAPQLLLWDKPTYGGEYDRIALDGKLRQLGGSMTALELYALRAYIDYFLEEEGMNEEKLGVAGLSYGGMYALHLAAVDERIKACYSCSWVCDAFIQSWADWSYFGAQNTFTVVETVGLVAPRPLVVAMGDKDELFNSEVTIKTCERAREYYTAYGADEAFKVVVFDGNHELDKKEEELDFFFDKLKAL